MSAHQSLSKWVNQGAKLDNIKHKAKQQNSRKPADKLCLTRGTKTPSGLGIMGQILKCKKKKKKRQHVREETKWDAYSHDSSVESLGNACQLSKGPRGCMPACQLSSPQCPAAFQVSKLDALMRRFIGTTKEGLQQVFAAFLVTEKRSLEICKVFSMCRKIRR